MSNNDNDSGKYWPYMILGFLFIGLTLGYWTIKNTISLPVHESNEFMQKYQEADSKAREIEDSEARFDAKYNVEVKGLEKTNFKPKHLKRKAHIHYKLDNKVSYSYIVTTKDGKVVNSADVTLLLTRPQTEKDDFKYGKVAFENGEYKVKDLKVNKLGRYILRARVKMGNDTKYIDTYGVKLK
jgi:hypothetical protein